MDLARHVLIAGLTGAHKTTAVTLPALVDAAAAGVSAVAFDLKYGERDSLAGAAPEWWRRGRTVLVYAPLDAASLRWNPLASCRSPGDAHALAMHLFPDETRDTVDAGYWTGAERHVCAALVWATATDGGARAIVRLQMLADSGPDAVSRYIRRHPHAAAISARLGAYGAMLPKDQAGILQGIAARLESWTDERVAHSTRDDDSSSPDEIVLSRLRREPTLLVVGVPQAALPRLRTVCQLFMRMLAAEMLRPRGPDERVSVVYILEELPAWGPLPGLADHLATFRSRDVAIVATVQSEAQGEAVYGTHEWAAIAANFVTKIYLSSLADPDAERLSHALGTTRVAQISRSRGWTGRGRQDSEQIRVIDVPLSPPHVLQGIDAMEDEITLRCARLPPARLWCPPFYLRSPYSKLVPSTAPSTVEIAIRHRVTNRSSRIQTSPPRRSPADNRRLDESSAPDETVDLNRLIDALLSDRHDGVVMRVVCRAQRPVELRIEPALAFQALGGGEKSQAIVRRWAARRWVKHVRPQFVLERAALDLLEPHRRRQLFDYAMSTSSPGQSQGPARDDIRYEGVRKHGR